MRRLHVFGILLFISCACIGVPVHAEVTHQVITFGDLLPAGYAATADWDALGIDGNERIYIGFTCSVSGLEDVALFRYDPSTGSRKFLGTFMQTAKTDANYQTGESIPKGHTHMVMLNGKMYLGSQPFHDMKGEIYSTTNPADNINNFRGSHLFSWDLNAEVLHDEARTSPSGVLTVHEGIIALGYSTYDSLLIGYSHPLGNLVLYNYLANRVQKIAPGIPWTLGNPISREIIVTKNGKVYLYRGTEPPADSAKAFNVYCYDIAGDALTKLNFQCRGGFWVGQAATVDRSAFYIMTIQGMLYKLDAATDQWSALGYFLPSADVAQGSRITYLYGMTISPDEKKLYAVVSVGANAALSGNLYEFDIATRQTVLIKNVGAGCYCGTNLRDSRKNIYFARFGGSSDQWTGNCGLLIVNIKDRSGDPPTAAAFRRASGTSATIPDMAGIRFTADGRRSRMPGPQPLSPRDIVAGQPLFPARK